MNKVLYLKTSPTMTSTILQGTLRLSHGHPGGRDLLLSATYVYGHGTQQLRAKIDLVQGPSLIVACTITELAVVTGICRGRRNVGSDRPNLFRVSAPPMLQAGLVGCDVTQRAQDKIK